MGPGLLGTGMWGVEQELHSGQCAVCSVKYAVCVVFNVQRAKEMDKLRECQGSTKYYKKFGTGARAGSGAENIVL